jgi:hypothetical protein
MDEPSNFTPFSGGRRFSRRPGPGVVARLSSSNLEVLVPMSYSYISSEAKKVPNADPAHPPPELLFRRDSAPLLARLWELWERFRRTVSSPDGPYRRHAENHLAATASANPFLVRRDLPLLPSPSPTTAPGAWMTEARRATNVAWGERSASPSFCRSASFHRADTPRDEGGTRQADLYDAPCRTTRCRT